MKTIQQTLTISGCLLVAATAGACSMKLNGKSYGMGGGSDGSSSSSSSSSGGGGSSSSGSSDGAPEESRHERKNRLARERKLPEKPSDPWAMVDGDAAKLLGDEMDDYVPNTTNTDCTAAHDHCLPDWVWFVETKHRIEDRPLARQAVPHFYYNDENDGPQFGVVWSTRGGAYNMDQELVAHRTVPATKKNLTKGALAMVTNYPGKHPASEGDALNEWTTGIVSTIDWDEGKVRLVGHEDPFWISGTRVAVLTWTVGGKIEILRKAKRDELAVSVKDVILPSKDVGKVARPEDGVDQDGKPRTWTDTRKLESTSSVECDAAHDHCLRPWVWFVDLTTEAVPAWFENDQFYKVFEMDKKVTLKGAGGSGLAYRTVPATGDNMKAGQVVFFTQSAWGSESAALGDWELGKVANVEPEAGVFQIEGDDRMYKIAFARIATIMWFPGEKAEPI